MNALPCNAEPVHDLIAAFIPALVGLCRLEGLGRQQASQGQQGTPGRKRVMHHCLRSTQHCCAWPGLVTHAISSILRTPSGCTSDTHRYFAKVGSHSIAHMHCTVRGLLWHASHATVQLSLGQLSFLDLLLAGEPTLQGNCVPMVFFRQAS